MRKYFSATAAVVFSPCCGVSAFVENRQISGHCFTRLFAGKGFGNGGKSSGKKTVPEQSYSDDNLQPIKDLIDAESAMNEFFSANEDWKPLFRSIVDDTSVPAMTFFDEIDVTGFEFHEETEPWRRLEAIPTGHGDREVLADFLDKMQTSLIEIPVDESTEDDEHDLHFIEEGRRILVCSRFHVLQDVDKGPIESHDSLFAACWNEVMHLRDADEIDTGSLILTPGLNIEDLRRFTDMNLQRPLQWLGIDHHFEVASMVRGSPAIRLIYKLSGIPTAVATEEES